MTTKTESLFKALDALMPEERESWAAHFLETLQTESSGDPADDRRWSETLEDESTAEGLKKLVAAARKDLADGKDRPLDEAWTGPE